MSVNVMIYYLQILLQTCRQCYRPPRQGAELEEPHMSYKLLGQWLPCVTCVHNIECCGDTLSSPEVAANTNQYGQGCSKALKKYSSYEKRMNHHFKDTKVTLDFGC